MRCMHYYVFGDPAYTLFFSKKVTTRLVVHDNQLMDQNHMNIRERLFDLMKDREGESWRFF